VTTTVDEDTVAYAGVLGQAGMLRDGRLTSVELIDLLLRRIARLDPGIRAFRQVLADPARADAAAADAARAAGDPRPLLGVPIAIKDTVDVAGTATLLGTGSPQPTARADDELVRRFRDAGLVVIGKTQLPELAQWAVTESAAHGETRNPWDRRLSPGGSSGGSAAAVAAGMVPAAHATDGLGSIRIPAACSGLVGLKPTHGLVPLRGDHWEGMSHAGVLSRSVRDTAVLLDVATGSETYVPSLGTEPSTLRIAVTAAAATPIPLAAEVRRVLDTAAGLLRDLGHDVSERRPDYGRLLPMSTSVRYLAGIVRDVDDLVDPAAIEPRTRRLAAIGRRLPRRAVPWARDYGTAFGRRMASFFAGSDLLLTPTLPRLPPAAGRLGGRGLIRTLAFMAPYATYTGPWNACGLPAISLPVGTAAGDVPVGVQLIGPAGAESLLLGVAAQLESRCGWMTRRPCLD
jgi:amidase